MDYQRNKDQFFFSTYSSNSTQVGGGNRPLEDVSQIPTNWIATVGWTRTLSAALLNQFRANVTRWHYDQTNPTGTTNWGIPQIRLFDFDAGGFGDPGRIIGTGRSSTTPGKLAQNTFAFRDTMSWVRSRHALKFGFEIVREQNNNDQSGGFRPDYQFRGLLNLANDACCFFEEVSINPTTGGAPSGLRHYRTGNYALFAEDSWKFRPNLTFTLGLRWEYFSPLTEAHGLLTNYVFGSQGFLNGSVKPASQLYEGDKNNFGPRLAVAWSPNRSNGGLVLRSGFGILYNRYFGSVFSNVRQNTPFFAEASSCCFFDPGTIIGAPPGSNILYQIGSSSSLFSYAANPAFAHGVAPDGALCANAGCTAIQQVDLFGALPQEPNPYIYAYSAEAQWEFARNYVLTTGYYGSRSRKLVRTIDLNRLIPGDTFDGNRDFVQNASANGVACGPTNPACPAPVVTGNNRFNRIFFPLPDVNASYDSMVTTVRHRFSRGLEFSASYTWAHSIDTASYEIGYQQTDPSNQLINKGNSDYDVRHYFVAYAVWEVPLLRKRHDLLGNLLGGWTISPIFTKHSGFPYTALIGGCNTSRDRNGDSYCPDLPVTYAGGVLASPSKQDWMNGVFPNPATSFPNVSNDYAAHPPAPGTFGPGCRCRNIFTGPGFSSIDMTVGKQFALSNMPVLGEGARIDIHANFYNLFNILNLAPLVPATAQTDITNTGQFGKTPTGLAGRVIELQARFSF
jgi:outer membrane receptor protein involved in Fe transport